MVFRQTPGRSYRLVYGNAIALAPEYDFTSLTTQEQRAAAPLATVGEESHNAAYANPEPLPPWSERHGWVLWAALLAAVVVIGALSIRLMR